MMKSILSLLLFYPLAGLSCVAVRQPPTIENYDRVFFGEVLRVDLLPYEKVTLENGETEEIIPSDYTRDHSLTIKTSQQIKGSIDYEETLIAGGCGVLIPEIGQSGIFFTSATDQKAITVYESQTALYSEWQNILD